MASALSASLKKISIHALRAEGDWAMLAVSVSWAYFYPRPPCGGRQLLE